MQILLIDFVVFIGNKPSSAPPAQSNSAPSSGGTGGGAPMGGGGPMGLGGLFAGGMPKLKPVGGGRGGAGAGRGGGGWKGREDKPEGGESIRTFVDMFSSWI